MNVSLFSTFSGLSPGVVKGPDATGCFVNFYKYPIWVNDFVFHWSFVVPARASTATFGLPLGDTIRVFAKYRNHPLTNGFVPVNLVAPVTDWQDATPGLTAPGQTLQTTYTWKLGTPLWLPPNVPLSFEIQHLNDFAVDVPFGAQVVNVTARGYLDETAEVPQYVDVPYATAFLGAVQSTVVAGTTGLAPTVLEQTKQTDLFNPFTIPFNIDRLQYEIGVSSHGLDGVTNANFAPTDATSAQDQTSQLLAGQNYGLDRRYVLMKLTSSTGRNLVKDFVPIGTVISSQTRALDTRATLDPGHYYVAFLQEQMPLFTDRGPLPFQMRVGLSLVGSRRLSLDEALSTYSS